VPPGPQVIVRRRADPARCAGATAAPLGAHSHAPSVGANKTEANNPHEHEPGLMRQVPVLFET